ncbi:MAG: group II intron reverse transcriptase/maturase [Candidatus Thiodiazotropha endolucinida]|nr:group II intron reverse transcriptase/maturase [Candidatus Thiodiazotropha endolucinida]
MTNEKSSTGGESQQPALNDSLMERVLLPENLHAAWKQVKGNKGAPGVDGITIEDYPQWARKHRAATRRALEGGYYIPQSVKRVEIPKPNGGNRSLGIPTVNDRVIQQAIAQVLNPIIDPSFSESSHGFRPGRNAHGAVHQVKGFIEAGYEVAVDVALSKFFDRVNHDILMSRLSRYFDDKRLLKLIGYYLRAGVTIDGECHPTPEGVPQGGPLSPLLANVVLDDLDKLPETRALRFARYADDFTICVKSTSAGHRVMHWVKRFLNAKLKLVINEEKSKVVKTNELHFLGFTFKGKKIRWSDNALNDFKHTIRRLTKRSWGISMYRRYRELRLYIQGWINYYGLSEYYRPLPRLDEWIRRRMRMCYLKQWHKPRTRIRNLIKLGTRTRTAVSLGLSSKGPYRLARTLATQSGMTNKWLAVQGLVSVRELWIKFHYA